jgi:N-acetylmuramic acid 6-phosphate (MurNAc-6-P) etherase
MRKQAIEALGEAGGSAKFVIIMFLADVNADYARTKLEHANRYVRGAVE